MEQRLKVLRVLIQQLAHITEGQSVERSIQRLETADRMAEIEARWQHRHGQLWSYCLTAMMLDRQAQGRRT